MDSSALAAIRSTRTTAGYVEVTRARETVNSTSSYFKQLSVTPNEA